LAFLLLLVLGLGQSSIGHVWSVFGVTPNAVLVAVVCSGLLGGARTGTIWGVLGGLVLGLLSGAPFGAHMLVLGIIGYVAGLTQHSPFQSLFVIPTLTIAGATTVYLAGMAAILRLSGWPITLDARLLYMLAWAILLNAALMVVCYWVAAHVIETRSRTRASF